MSKDPLLSDLMGVMQNRSSKHQTQICFQTKNKDMTLPVKEHDDDGHQDLTR